MISRVLFRNPDPRQHSRLPRFGVPNRQEISVKYRVPLLLSATLLLSPAASLAATSITRAVVGAGGGAAAGATASVRSTVGQAAVGGAAGATISIGAGWWLQAPGAASGVPEDLPLPLVFRAYPNHPNPFNPRTTLAFDMPQAATRVSLRLYDLHGRLITALIDGPLPAGRHGVVWNGADDAGRAVASGVYVSVLETPLGRASGKLTLVR
jgi:hypothetical protein